MTINNNTLCHQAPNDQSNCGPYSLVFLALRAKGIPMERIKTERITTEQITHVRDRLYRRTGDYEPVPPK